MIKVFPPALSLILSVAFSLPVSAKIIEVWKCETQSLDRGVDRVISVYYNDQTNKYFLHNFQTSQYIISEDEMNFSLARNGVSFEKKDNKIPPGFRVSVMSFYINTTWKRNGVYFGNSSYRDIPNRGFGYGCKLLAPYPL